MKVNSFKVLFANLVCFLVSLLCVVQANSQTERGSVSKHQTAVKTFDDLRLEMFEKTFAEMESELLTCKVGSSEYVALKDQILFSKKQVAFQLFDSESDVNRKFALKVSEKLIVDFPDDAESKILFGLGALWKSATGNDSYLDRAIAELTKATNPKSELSDAIRVQAEELFSMLKSYKSLKK